MNCEKGALKVDLEAEILKTQKLEKELAELLEKYNKLLSQKTDLYQELDWVKIELENQKLESNQSNTQNNYELNEKNKAIESKIKTFLISIGAKYEIETLKQQLDDTRTLLKQENNDISTQLEHRDGIISDLESKITDLNQTIQEKDKILHEKSLIEANLEASEAKVKNLESQNNEFKANLELSKGILSSDKVNFKTNLSSGASAFNFNIYDFGLNVNSILSFMIASQNTDRNFIDFQTIKLNIITSGNFFEQIKEADTKKYKNSLIIRNK